MGCAVDERMSGEHGRKGPLATVVAPPLDTDPQRAAAQLHAYAAAGTERVILPPRGSNWQRDYEFAAQVRAAL